MSTSKRPPEAAPAWLIDLAKKPKAQDRGSRRRDGASTATVAVGPIHEGVRNQTLFFIALDRKDSGRCRDEALEEILSINEARCSPPLE